MLTAGVAMSDRVDPQPVISGTAETFNSLGTGIDDPLDEILARARVVDTAGFHANRSPSPSDQDALGLCLLARQVVCSETNGEGVVHHDGEKQLRLTEGRGWALANR